MTPNLTGFYKMVSQENMDAYLQALGIFLLFFFFLIYCNSVIAENQNDLGYAAKMLCNIFIFQLMCIIFFVNVYPAESVSEFEEFCISPIVCHY